MGSRRGAPVFLLLAILVTMDVASAARVNLNGNWTVSNAVRGEMSVCVCVCVCVCVFVNCLKWGVGSVTHHCI